MNDYFDKIPGIFSFFFLARLRERRFMEEVVHVNCRHVHSWLGRCGTAAKGLVWYGCWDAPNFPSAAFFPVGVLKGGNNMVDSAAPSLKVSSKCRLLVVVNVTRTEGFLEGIFKTFLWCPSVTIACGEFTIEGYLRQTMPPTKFWRYAYLPNPSARAGYDTRSIFKRSLTGLNSEFSFS